MITSHIAIGSYSYVLDSSAVIAFLNGEPGMEVVEPILDVSIISTINWAEVITWLTSSRNLLAVNVDDARALLEHWGLTTTPLTEAEAEVAGLLTVQTRQAGLSLADRVALAVGMEFGLPVLSADRNWAKVDVGAEVRFIR